MNWQEAKSWAKSWVAFRWLVAGFLVLGVNSVALYLFAGRWGMKVIVATLLSAEFCTLLRFVLNEWWVFGTRHFGWTRIWQYHTANVGAFVVWWFSANLLTRLGLNYLIASAAAVAFSTGFSFVSNVFWVWRKPRPALNS